ncbi:VPLPA-CTERM sorting domain-containing protein [Methylomonas rivi]|uniref:VPLPA-CTERM sorting domain-containing protein n=1 Tax=Methylomonas rivi TaxID=2952226 RepID=A0ABT1UA40_9GAMM|nr:VPLPA-CTERM sorting domain-containing protein [Methylomonas sp. WSC-6]MCQ8130724.1 VPLPA-CTERM sorting domain-containing protein [Methylomonas sp. WSC-6]
MKILAKSVAVAAIAMSMTGVAEARIQAIGDATADGSELLLNVVNYTAQNSYTLDLGVTIAQFLANPSQPLSFALNDNNFQSFASAYTAGDNVTWGVSGGHGLLNEETDLPIFGFYTTSVTNAPAAIDDNAADISNTMGKWNGLVSAIQTQDANANNLSTFKTVGQLGYTAVYGNDFQTALPFVAQGQLGAALAFVHEKVNAEDGLFDTGELEVFAGSWKLDLTGNTGSLTYTTSTVPLPGAVWMFGAALMGMLGVGRRKVIAA